MRHFYCIVIIKNMQSFEFIICNENIISMIDVKNRISIEFSLLTNEIVVSSISEISEDDSKELNYSNNVPIRRL